MLGKCQTLFFISFQGGHFPQRKRHLSVSKGSDFQDNDFYSDVKPHPSALLETEPKIPETFQDKAAMEHKRQTGFREFEMPLLGNIVLEGQLLPASGMYGCFMTMSGSYSLNADLPDNFRVSFCIYIYCVLVVSFFNFL